MRRWARSAEAALGAWLVASALVLGAPGGDGFVLAPIVGGTLVIVVALVARARPLLRLLGLALSLGLIAWGWAAFARPGPAIAQSAILSGLMLGLLAIVPTDAAEPPPAWRRFMKPEAASRASRGGARHR